MTAPDHKLSESDAAVLELDAKAGEVAALRRIRELTGWNLQQAKEHLGHLRMRAAPSQRPAERERKNSSLGPILALLLIVAIGVPFVRWSNSINRDPSPAAIAAGEAAGNQLRKEVGPNLDSDTLAKYAISQGKISGYSSVDRTGWENAFLRAYRQGK